MVLQLFKKKRKKTETEKLEEEASKRSRYAELKKSSIHNKGLFAKKFIPRRTKIIEYTGEKITKKEAEKRAEEQYEKGEQGIEGHVYIFELNKKYDIDGNKPGNIAKYINHSCNPNCETEIIDNHIWVIALRNIYPGEELTYNYGYDVENFEDHPCYCGSDKCVGYIVEEKQWPKLRKKLAKKKN